VAQPQPESSSLAPAVQSASSASPHSLGQQPSPLTQLTIAVLLHAALQLAALPVMVSTVQPSPSSQLCGQLAGGSHVSPGSIAPLPQLA
jgi:hypothetical protein